MVKKFLNVGALVSLLISSVAAPAAAQEQMLFPAIDDASAAIISKINSETLRVDVAVWYLQDRGITNALINKFKSGVPVRVIGDWLPLFVIDPATRAEFELLANAGIPIRLRYHPTWFPEAMHWKCGIFVGQHTVEFGSANWTPFELTPWSSTDFKDETAFFTNDAVIVNGFLTQFDTMWADTTYFLDFPEVYKLQTGNTWPKPMNISRTRLEPDHPVPPGMIWGQGPGLNGAIATEIDKEQKGVDLVIYRLSDPVIADAAIRRLQAGVPVRVILEPTQYRQPDWPEYWLTGAQVDRLWVAGAQIKQRQHQGLMHMKSVITSNVALNGSSNFTRNWQRDHNYFISATAKPAIYLAMKDRFNAMWNDSNGHYVPFAPQRPEAVVLVGPAQNTTGISTTPTFEWKRARWATSFDVYLGIAGGAMTKQARVNAQLTEDPPQTYTWTPAQPLQPGTTYQWAVVSRTIATDVNAALTDTSNTFTFTTGGASPGPPASSLPGTIEAENFDAGPSGTAYFDNSPGNNGGAYRNTDVDIAAAQDTGGGYTLGWVGAGEWLRYTVNVATAGTYDIEVRVASDGTGGRFHIEVNGVDKTGQMIVPNTGGWQNWVTIKKTGVALASGTQTWHLIMDANGPGGAVANFNWFRVVAAGSTPPPPPTEVCGNGIDDDGDGLIDEGCTPTPPPPPPTEVCGNGIDDDGDGLIDEGCAPPPPAAPEIVIHTASVPTANLKGNWARVNDASAASGAKVASADLAAGTVSAPLAAPVNYFDVTFTAQAGVRYRLWLRMSAAGNSKWNDSVYVQFSGSVDGAGNPRYRIGTAAGLNVNQATCADCPPTGWGWQNRGYWEPDTGEIWFATTGTQTIRIQIREDGVAIDQIILSPVTYVNTAPGPATNDSKIVPKS